MERELVEKHMGVCLSVGPGFGMAVHHLIFHAAYWLT